MSSLLSLNFISPLSCLPCSQNNTRPHAYLLLKTLSNPNFIHCCNWLSNSSLFCVCLGFKSIWVLVFTNPFPYQGPCAPSLVTPTDALSREKTLPGSQHGGCTLSCQPRALSLEKGWHAVGWPSNSAPAAARPQTACPAGLLGNRLHTLEPQSEGKG